MYKIIALSIAAAMASTAVNAEVTISGSVRTAFEYSSPDDVGVKAGSRNDGSNKFQLVDQSSRIRFAGKDKLDFGGELIWVLENRFRVGDAYDRAGSDTWGSRDTYVGYKGDFGFARFGKMDNAYKAIYRNISPVLDGNINDTSGYTGTSSMLRRLGNRDAQVVYYETPSFNGFGAHGSWTIGEQTAAYDAHTYQVGAFWSDKMFNVGAVYSMNKDQASDYKTSRITLGKGGKVEDMSGFMVGANAKFMDFGLGLTYENLTRDDGKKSRDQDSFAVAASYKLDKLNFLATYVNVGDVDDLSESGGDQLSLGATYNLSKKSRVYATYTMLNNDKNASFTTESGYTVNNGQSVDLFSVGVRTDF